MTWILRAVWVAACLSSVTSFGRVVSVPVQRPPALQLLSSTGDVVTFNYFNMPTETDGSKLFLQLQHSDSNSGYSTKLVIPAGTGFLSYQIPATVAPGYYVLWVVKQVPGAFSGLVLPVTSTAFEYLPVLLPTDTERMVFMNLRTSTQYDQPLYTSYQTSYQLTVNRPSVGIDRVRAEFWECIGTCRAEITIRDSAGKVLSTATSVLTYDIPEIKLPSRLVLARGTKVQIDIRVWSTQKIGVFPAGLEHRDGSSGEISFHALSFTDGTRGPIGLTLYDGWR